MTRATIENKKNNVRKRIFFAEMLYLFFKLIFTRMIMPIEILYIIPVLAIAIFVVFLLYHIQKKPQMPPPGLYPEKKRFGDTRFLAAQKSTEQRLSEFESTISSINKALTDQQAVIGKYQTENSTYNDEIEKLRSKLRDLHKEYDIVISENYSLRAKVKSIQSKAAAATPEVPSQPAGTSYGKEHIEMNMNLYEDTRLFKSSTLDDTREFNASELN